MRAMAPNTVCIRVDGSDQVGEARRSAAAMAAEVKLDAAEAARLALIVTECASNLWKHGGGGEILLNPLPGAGCLGMEVLALDKGPGMTNIAMCFQDGYSTAGSPGTGLGAVQRLSSECDIYSTPGKGTALLARMRSAKNSREACPPGYLETGGVSVPMRGESLCGDGYAVWQGADFATVMVADGLGHGPLANDCAVAAHGAFVESCQEQPTEILSSIHAALRSTRGAAVSVARLDWTRREIRYAGIGNVSGLVYDDLHSRQMVSQPGIAGHDTRNVREFTYAWPVNALVLLYSDGISTHWSLDLYRGLLLRDTSMIAGVLYRDWNRGRDDATMLVIRERPVA
jgi:anti-sigma regulatory factor (Ser/Thr protein kinase)